MPLIKVFNSTNIKIEMKCLHCVQHDLVTSLYSAYSKSSQFGVPNLAVIDHDLVCRKPLP